MAARRAGEQLREVAALSQQIELKRQKRFLPARGCRVNEQRFETVEKVRVGVVLLEELRDQLPAA